ncbi:unnamed protein product [Staurois parvus]|uniref:Uncharacterized protein n=2 Tax=Staurois parvus TaxID=386267 RepID=A0ABN9E1V4_9NEOB|nr:unnamed protein product [Staurois parvus]
MRDSGSTQHSDRRSSVSLGHSRGDMYTDHQGTDDPCALMISVAPEVPPVSVHQCQLSVLNSATCQCPSLPHQCHISVPTSAHQCHISVPI